MFPYWLFVTFGYKLLTTKEYLEIFKDPQQPKLFDSVVMCKDIDKYVYSCVDRYWYKSEPDSLSIRQLKL